MANMSYCRFRNTENDLQDCANTLYELEGGLQSLSPEEARAAQRLIELCRDIVDSFVDGDGEIIEDFR